MVEVVCSMRMSVGVGGVGNRGEGEVSSGGAERGGARWKDCCRFPNGNSGELREDLPCRLPFTLDIDNVFL